MSDNNQKLITKDNLPPLPTTVEDNANTAVSIPKRDSESAANGLGSYYVIIVTLIVAIIFAILFLLYAT